MGSEPQIGSERSSLKLGGKSSDMSLFLPPPNPERCVWSSVGGPTIVDGLRVVFYHWGVSNLDFFQTFFQTNLSQKKVAFQSQFLSHVKKRKAKRVFFQKLFSEKK